MGRIIINNDSDLSDYKALKLVIKSIKGRGKCGFNFDNDHSRTFLVQRLVARKLIEITVSKNKMSICFKIESKGGDYDKERQEVSRSMQEQ